jgi:hypothetical protein
MYQRLTGNLACLEYFRLICRVYQIFSDGQTPSSEGGVCVTSISGDGRPKSSVGPVQLSAKGSATSLSSSGASGVAGGATKDTTSIDGAR